MVIMIRKIVFFSFVLMAFGALSPQAKAQIVLTEVNQLNFGTFAMRDLSTVAEVTVNPTSGSTTVNAEAVLISSGQRGEFNLTGGPGNSVYTVTIDATTNPTFGGGGGKELDLAIGNFTTAPAILITDGAGADTLFIGGRLDSAGDGGAYTDGTYLGDFDFTVNF